MIQVNDVLYPIGNILKIVIDRPKLSITYNFKKDLQLMPVVEKFDDEKGLNAKIGELHGTKKSRTLLG